MRYLESLLEPKLLQADVRDGVLNVAVTGKLVEHIGRTFIKWFVQNDAKNYLEMCFSDPNHPDTRYVVHVQKYGEGTKTPHELRIEAEARVAELEAEKN